MAIFGPPVGRVTISDATTLGGKVENQLSVASAVTATTASNALLLNSKASTDFALYSHVHDYSPNVISVVGPINTPPTDDPYFNDYESLTNGNFDTDISGWETYADGTFTISGTTFVNTDTYDSHNYIRIVVNEAEGYYSNGAVYLHQSYVNLEGIECCILAVRVSLNDETYRDVGMFVADNDGSNFSGSENPVKLTGTGWNLYTLDVSNPPSPYTSSQRFIIRVRHNYNGLYSAASYNIDIAYIRVGVIRTLGRYYLVGLNPTGAFSGFADSLVYYSVAGLAWDDTGNIGKLETK